MNTPKLAEAIRRHAEEVKSNEGNRELIQDTVELLRVLARMIEGKDIAKAFGAPGDWGYNTPIGSALAERQSG